MQHTGYNEGLVLYADAEESNYELDDAYPWPPPIPGARASNYRPPPALPPFHATDEDIPPPLPPPLSETRLSKRPLPLIPPADSFAEDVSPPVPGPKPGSQRLPLSVPSVDARLPPPFSGPNPGQRPPPPLPVDNTEEDFSQPSPPRRQPGVMPLPLRETVLDNSPYEAMDQKYDRLLKRPPPSPPSSEEVEFTATDGRMIDQLTATLPPRPPTHLRAPPPPPADEESEEDFLRTAATTDGAFSNEPSKPSSLRAPPPPPDESGDEADFQPLRNGYDTPSGLRVGLDHVNQGFSLPAARIPPPPPLPTTQVLGHRLLQDLPMRRPTSPSLVEVVETPVPRSQSSVKRPQQPNFLAQALLSEFTATAEPTNYGQIKPNIFLKQSEPRSLEPTLETRPSRPAASPAAPRRIASFSELPPVIASPIRSRDRHVVPAPETQQLNQGIPEEQLPNSPWGLTPQVPTEQPPTLRLAEQVSLHTDMGREVNASKIFHPPTPSVALCDSRCS